MLQLFGAVEMGINYTFPVKSKVNKTDSQKSLNNF